MKKFYTRKGDQGTTGLLGESRVAKSHPRIRAVGALDEASAAMGMARALTEDPELVEIVKTTQMDLYTLMSQIVLESPDQTNFPDLAQERVTWLESTIQHYQESIPDLKGFILPGENPTSAAFSMARTIIRRSERETVALVESGLVSSETVLPYLNRLSSLCFILELYTSGGISPASPKT